MSFVKTLYEFTISHTSILLSFTVGLAGKTDMEKAQADMIVDCIVDVIKLIVDYLHENEELKKVCTLNEIVLYLENLNK